MSTTSLISALTLIQESLTDGQKGEVELNASANVILTASRDATEVRQFLAAADRGGSPFGILVSLVRDLKSLPTEVATSLARATANVLTQCEDSRKAACTAGLGDSLAQALQECRKNIGRWAMALALLRSTFILVSTQATECRKTSSLETWSKELQCWLTQEHKEAHDATLESAIRSEVYKCLFAIQHASQDKRLELDGAIKAAQSMICAEDAKLITNAPFRPAVEFLFSQPIDGLAECLGADELTLLSQQVILSLDYVIAFRDVKNSDALDEAILSIFPDADELLAPYVLLLRTLASLGSPCRKVVLDKVIPQDLDRARPVDQADSLTGRLVNIMRSALLPTLAKCVGELFWTCFDEQAESMTTYMGYGNAAGFLVSKDVAWQEPSLAKISEIRESNIDPITGSTTSVAEPSLAEMTEEEKEREAERLFVLFERLNATGVVKVPNPVSSLHNHEPH